MVLVTLLATLAFGQEVELNGASTAPIIVTHTTPNGDTQDDPANLSAILSAKYLDLANVHMHTTAQKTSQIAGGYRWQVHVEVAVDRPSPVAAMEFSFNVPVVLQYEHLDGIDAVRAASAGIELKFTQEWLQLNK